MRLYINQTSPYARKARVAAHETGLVPRIQFIDADPWAEPADLLAATPLSKVPVLCLGEGLRITESDTIAQVLDGLEGRQRLLPADPAARAAVLSRSALAQGLIDASFQCVLEERRPAPHRWQDWVARQHRALERTLSTLEQEFTPLADRFDLGDIGMACARAYLDFRLPGLSWRERCPRWAAWADTTAQRHSMQATRPA